MSTATRTRSKPKAADAPAAPPLRPVSLSAVLEQQILEKRNRIHEFRLVHTETEAGVPLLPAKVRIPDLGDPAMLMNLPSDLLKTILVAVNTVEEQEGTQGPIDLNKPDTIDFERAKREAVRNRALIDAYCLSGFIEPPLVMTEKEQTTTAHVLLSTIHPADRSRFFNWCSAQGVEATATVTEFPGGPSEGVAVGGSGGVDGGATEPPPEVDSDGGE